MLKTRYSGLLKWCTATAAGGVLIIPASPHQNRAPKSEEEEETEVSSSSWRFSHQMAYFLAAAFLAVFFATFFTAFFATFFFAGIPTPPWFVIRTPRGDRPRCSYNTNCADRLQ
jgi:hypothetical protein